ncbi:MAG: class I SAM-dependent DNA methyltransferase [Bacillota bacterium]|jgi:SAM-dependent methyltransferase|nr:methyltransferase domain-containing protein [Candidatus Fermentithermobacillaceae bacterium]
MARSSKKSYIHFADIYDQVMADVPYRRWLDYIQSVWSFLGFSPVTVLDLACGTGNMTLELALRGYDVMGVDSSATMLAVAQRKFQAHGLKGEFLQSDMRDFTIGKEVDAVVSVFDSLNYLLEPSDVKKTFACVAQCLRVGGVFLFDVNTPERLAIIPKETHIMEGSDYYLVWSDSYDCSREWWRVKLTGFIKDAGAWRRFDEIHRERAFPLDSLSEWLTGAGFEVMAVYDSLSFRPAGDSTSRAYFVARKEAP